MVAPKNNNIENKVQASLIPFDIILPMLEPAYREGIIKYQKESWRAGFNSSVMYDALMRHLKAFFFDLESYDPESQEKFAINKHHLGAAMFCLINLYNTDMNFPELDDRPQKLFREFLDKERTVTSMKKEYAKFDKSYIPESVRNLTDEQQQAILRWFTEGD